MPDPQIHPDIVETAVQRVGHLEGRPGAEYSWKVDRLDRRHSVVYRLTDEVSDTTLYYKILLPRENEPAESIDSLHNRLSRATTLTERLIGETSATQISPAPVLAAEPDRRTLVTLGMNGREIARRYWPFPGSKSNPFRYARLMGEACALIERTGSEQTPPFDFERLSWRVEYRLKRSEIDMSRANAIRGAVLELATARLGPGGAVFVHGDLSPSNILLSSAGIALIDFGWESRFRGFDVGLLSHRLRGFDRLFPGRGAKIRASLLTGYRTAAGTTYDADWLRLADLVIFVRALGSRSARIRAEAEMALDGILTDSRSMDREIPNSGDGEFRWWWTREA